MLERIIPGRQKPDIHQQVRAIGEEAIPRIGAAGEQGSPGVRPARVIEGSLIKSESGGSMIIPDEDRFDGIAVQVQSKGSVQGEQATNTRYRSVVLPKSNYPDYSRSHGRRTKRVKSPANTRETLAVREVTERDQGTRAEFKQRGVHPGEYVHRFGDDSKDKAVKLMAELLVKQAERDAPPQEHEQAA